MKEPLLLPSTQLLTQSFLSDPTYTVGKPAALNKAASKTAKSPHPVISLLFRSSAAVRLRNTLFRHALLRFTCLLWVSTQRLIRRKVTQGSSASSFLANSWISGVIFDCSPDRSHLSKDFDPCSTFNLGDLRAPEVPPQPVAQKTTPHTKNNRICRMPRHGKKPGLSLS